MEYHRHHRVCEHHLKILVVIIKGREQSFCQQCSREDEFDLDLEDIMVMEAIWLSIQLFVGLEGLERSFGLDPSDPIVKLVLLLGTSGSLWCAYWFLCLLERKMLYLLMFGPRQETEYRERDGVPDLRCSARFQYASVTLPKFQGESSIKKLLKSGKDLDDSLIAAIIQNLKIVQLESGKPSLRLLYVIPKLIATPGFMLRLTKIRAKGLLNLIDIDEAHCISSWGHDFRSMSWLETSLQYLSII